MNHEYCSASILLASLLRGFLRDRKWRLKKEISYPQDFVGLPYKNLLRSLKRHVQKTEGTSTDGWRSMGGNNSAPAPPQMIGRFLCRSNSASAPPQPTFTASLI
ncbi:MAG: hypothetical protein MUD14_25200 [Hydrococcus sp. Prado102]|nr:hypothetical protein [Hydrococcus sp. Prado102]